METTLKTFARNTAALIVGGGVLAFAWVSPAFALLTNGDETGLLAQAQTPPAHEYVQNFTRERSMELSNQRVPLESVIARIQSRCPGRVINARHDAQSNRYIVRWETNRQRIVSFQADASTGRIISGGC